MFAKNKLCISEFLRQIYGKPRFGVWMRKRDHHCKNVDESMKIREKRLNSVEMERNCVMLNDQAKKTKSAERERV